MKPLIIPCLLLLAACNQQAGQQQTAVPEEPVKRGEHLVLTLGCNDCHSPKIMTDKGPVPDPERLLSGHNQTEVLPPYDAKTAAAYVLFNMNNTAATGPWGTSFAANLTPDSTGIGSWSKEQFFKAIRQGKWKGLDNGRMLLPPMPWPSYSHLPDEDINAMYAYLKSIKPVKNVVPQPLPPAAAR